METKRKLQNTLHENRKKRWTKIEEDMDFISTEKETAGEPVSTRSETSGNTDKDKTFYLEGNRVVDLCHIGRALENGCKQCGERPLSRPNILSEISERNLGFYSIVKIKCKNCAALISLHTQKENNNHKGPHDINQMAVLGTLHSGMGVTHLNAVMSSLEVPCLTENGYKKVENYVEYKGIEPEAKESCARGRGEEKCLSSVSGLSGESVSVDQGWQKRRTAMNSRSGHSSMIGELSKKIFDYEVKIKTGCKTCEHS